MPPKLNVKHLKAAVDNLYYSHSDASYDCFAALHLVKQRMKMSAYSGIQQSVVREYAVQTLLCELIEVKLCQQRKTLAVYHRPMAHLHTCEQAYRDIRGDALPNSPILIGWSLLYHVQLRPDLNISHGQFAELASITPRSALRYKNQAIELLLRYILELELKLLPDPT